MITKAIYDILTQDAELTGMVSSYKNKPAIFTVDPAPEDAEFPYILTAGETVQTPWDTKQTRGRQIWRDIRIYSEMDGSAVTVETIAERVRELLHRTKITGTNFSSVWTECEGPTKADDGASYGRIITIKITIEEI